MDRLTIRLLGSFEPSLRSEPVSRFETDKDRALLAYLAVEDQRSHRREALAEMLWPGRPRGAARANLRHSLRNVRQVIGDRTPSGDRSRSGEPDIPPPFVLATRDTIQLNPEARIWVDTAAFLQLLEGNASNAAPTVSQLEGAVRLYRGPFLEDIAVADSPTFHEWVLLKREYFRHRAMGALHRLAQCYEIQGMHQRALEYAWRQVALEPWDERGHRQVMRLLALDGRRGAALAQYETCCQLLAEELGVEPDVETTDLFEQIRDDTLDIPAGIRKPALVLELPGFLDEAEGELEPPVFVTRERELDRLDSFLEQALNGHGRVAFVTGGPGQGKTALLDAFARRAMDKHPHLLVARGNCSAYSGVGDPYLPFRNLLAMLTGDVEARWAAGAISRDHARRLWKALPTALEALLTRGAALIGPILQPEALLSRAAAVLPHRVNWLKRLRARTGQARDGPVELEQSFIFEQWTSVLRTLAEHHPLVLVLDDFQWADRASISLLFHLGRRLAGSRILITCAYRPEEVALGRDGQRHPLEKVVHEFKRTFGDVRLDLDRADAAEGRRFVDALLDTEANRLGEGFRGALYRRTGGHPLFTIELLRAMQEREELVRDVDGDGAWIEGPTLDWEILPARVEAVIEQRVSRLDPVLQEIVSVASVEGEVFTAQVLAAVRGTAEAASLRRLTQELEGQHRLVSEQEEVQVGSRRLDRYKFSHILVQDHVYRQLGRGERRVLHGQVGAALEGLYQGEQDEIAVQLALHFHKAGDDRRAFQHLVLAAENAARSYANEEAAAHYTRAIELAERVSPDAISLTKLHRGRGQARETLGEFKLAWTDHETALRVAIAGGERREQWQARIDLGRLWTSRDYDRARDHFRRALELAQRMGDPRVLAGSLNWLGNWHLNAENPRAALAHHERALEILQRLGDRRGVARTLDLLGIASLLSGDVIGSVGYYDRAIPIFRELDDRPNLASSLTGRGQAGGHAYTSLAVVPSLAPPEARRNFEEALRITQEISSPAGEAWVLWSLGLLNTVQGRYGQALEVTQRGLNIALQIGHREWIVASRCARGILYLELLAPERARQQLEAALTRAKELRSLALIHYATGALAACHCTRPDLPQAETCLEAVRHPATRMDSMYKRYCWAWRAELAMCRGDPGLALDIAERLIASAPGMAPGRVITFLWKLKGEALGAMGHVEAARTLLQAAIENARSTGERFLLWRLHASLGRLCRATDRRSEAEKASATARARIQELAETVPAGKLRDGFLQRARESLGSSP
jgi:DNA-binding SARP family transcriptional activator/Tfp pilus assembly protein PilF